MPVFKHSLPVSCTPEIAFEYVADWNNFKNYMPMFVALKPVSYVQYGPGLSLETTLMLAKMEIITTLDLVEFVKNQRILFKASRGLKSKIGWDFKPLGNQTLIMFSFEYEIPPGLVSRDSQREALEKDMQDQLNQNLGLLKWVLEAQSAGEKRT